MGERRPDEGRRSFRILHRNASRQDQVADLAERLANHAMGNPTPNA